MKAIKHFLMTILLSGIAWITQAQSTHDVMLSGGLDLIKTDIDGVFEKAQVGFDINYFVVRHFSVGAGAEIWSERRNSFVMGVRWYANESFFLRFRGLIGANDAALGAGYAKALSQYFRLEGIGDFYFDTTEFGLRVGVSYVIR